MIELDLLITRSLTLPRAVTSRMRDSLRSNPTRAIRYDRLVDHLTDNMVRAYRLGFREFGSLRRDTERAMRAEFRRKACLLYTSPSPRDGLLSRMPSSA